MKNLNIRNSVITCLAVILSGICSLGLSQKKSDASVQKGGINLEYKYSADKNVKYLSDTKIVQDMDINGQSMLVNISMSLGCEVKSAGKQGENLNLEIKIDTMAQNVESPQGSAGGPVNDVKGKVFNIIISPSGKIIDLSGASKVVYTIEGSGESNMNQSFLSYFPVLPKNSVQPGDTWTTNDTIDSKSQSNSVWMPVAAAFKYEGLEKINGIDCAKITATLTGTRKMTTQSQGMEIHTSGPFTGTQTLFFAVNEGYFVKQTVVSKMTGNIEIPDQNMSFPVVMTITSTNEIVK
jgi:hypothetical protein